MRTSAMVLQAAIDLAGARSQPWAGQSSTCRRQGQLSLPEIKGRIASGKEATNLGLISLPGHACIMGGVSPQTKITRSLSLRMAVVLCTSDSGKSSTEPALAWTW